MDSGEQLCLACGLCCDGTLFDIVRLGTSDDAKQLKTLGLPVKLSRAQTPATYFRQPCSALCSDRTCSVYANRPGQCRTFECGVFKDAQASRITQTAALRLVKKARKQAENIRRLLRKLGDTDEHRSLSERLKSMQKHIEAGVVDVAASDTYAELALAMHRHHLLVHEKFHIRAEAS